MTRALDHGALLSSAPAENLPLALIAAARSHGARPALRHKRAGIWHTVSFADHLAQAAGMARLLEGAGLGAGGVLVTVGENRPELYAAHLAAQALGAAALPLGPEFLRRFGAPAAPAAIVLCLDEAAAGAWQAAAGEMAGPVLRLDQIAPPAGDGHEEGLAWFAYRAAGVAADQTALLLHTDGQDGPPRMVPLSHARLLEAGRGVVAALGLGPDDSAMAFLPMSSIGDAAVSLVQGLLAGLCVHCVEGPASFPADLREVAPTYLPAPSRAFELLDRETQRRLSAGGAVVRALARAAGKGPGSRLLFSAPLLNAIGLRRCRIAIATGAPLEAGACARLRLWGVPLDGERVFSEAGALVARADGPGEGAQARQCAQVEALLRGQPEIERARVIPQGDGLLARLTLDDSAINAFIEAQGTAADAGRSESPAVRDLLARRVAQVNAALERQPGAAGPAQLRINAFELAPDGFPPAELTLEGDVRRLPPGAGTAGEALPAAGRRTEAAVGRRVIGAPLMEVRGVHVAFGGIKALTDVSLQVRAGEILSIIGPNGAGKTSLLNVINGVYHPRAGAIAFEGRTRARMRPALAARSGIGRTFQHVSLFKGMNVLDNVLSGRAARFRGALLGPALRLPAATAQEVREREAAERVLAFLELEHLRRVPVSTLPYGIQKRVELARALAAEPRLLLLDEPMAGMTHEEKREMCAFIRAVNESFGTTIVIIEHDIGVVMGLSDRVVVLNYGRKIADGTPAQVRADPDVIAAYLGSAAVGERAA